MLDWISSLLIATAYAVAPNDLNPGTPRCTNIFATGGLNAPGSGFGCAEDFIAMLTYVAIVFSASICLVMLIINGFRYMIGPAIPGGSSDAAKKGITSALMGLLLALLTYVLLDTLVFSVTGG